MNIKKRCRQCDKTYVELYLLMSRSNAPFPDDLKNPWKSLKSQILGSFGDACQPAPRGQTRQDPRRVDKRRGVMDGAAAVAICYLRSVEAVTGNTVQAARDPSRVIEAGDSGAARRACRVLRQHEWV